MADTEDTFPRRPSRPSRPSLLPVSRLQRLEIRVQAIERMLSVVTVSIVLALAYAWLRLKGATQ